MGTEGTSSGNHKVQEVELYIPSQPTDGDVVEEGSSYPPSLYNPSGMGSLAGYRQRNNQVESGNPASLGAVVD